LSASNGVSSVAFRDSQAIGRRRIARKWLYSSYRPREEIHKRIEQNVMGDYEKYGYGRYAVILKETDEFIGFSGLKYLEELNEVELGYRFLRKCWGKGIATEAGRPFIEYGFGELGLKKIIGLVHP
jgi:ribosomal-protein-alanine N-acetyltransferase